MLPDYNNPQRLIDLICKSYVLEFKLVEEYRTSKVLEVPVPNGFEILYEITGNHGSNTKKGTPYLVKKKPLLTGEYIIDASVRINQYDSPYIAISFNENGAKIFEQITSENIDKRLAIVLDNEIYSTPVIMEKIPNGRAQISGNFTIPEARDFVIALLSGSYPAHTKVIEIKKIDRQTWLGDM